MSEREPAKGSGQETSEALANVLRDQKEREQRRSETHVPKEPNPVPTRVAIAVLLPLTVWMWLSPPALLRPPPVEPPPRLVSAGVHMDLYVAAVQLGDYREANGRLPATLAEAMEDPEDAEDITYERLDGGRYRLTASRGGNVVVHLSTEPLSSLVSQARPTLEGNE